MPEPTENPIVQFAKGAIEAGALNTGGDLSPEQSSAVLKLVFEDPFLSRVTTRPMRRLTATGRVLDVPVRGLRRVAQGSEPTADQRAEINNFNYSLKAEEATLFPQITFDFLRDNQDMPTLVSDIESSLMTQTRGDLVDLGFNGQGADYAGDDADFLKLNEGWIKVAKDSADTKTLVIDPATDGWVTTLANVLEQQERRFYSGAAMIMSIADHNAYALEIGKHVTGNEYIVDNKAGGILTYPIISNMAVPDGTVMFTNPKNLVFGLNTNIYKARVVDELKRVVDYVFGMSVDFEIAAKQAVTLATTA